MPPDPTQCRQPGDPLGWIDPELAALERAGLRRQRRLGTGIPRKKAGGNGTVGDTVDFGSNDYLGLARDPRLAEAAARAAARWGWGSGASPVVSGRSALHAELEERIAQFEQTEAALLFPTGFAANAGVVPALVGEGDLILSDAKNHASLIDGCRLARAERLVYPHGDTAAVESLLASAGPRRRTLIVTDGLFSMDGDFAPLAELGDLAERHGAMLLVDEAHATGVWGAGGRGSVELAAEACPAVERQVAVRVGTLSKGLGSAGGFVAGPRRLIDWLYNRARPYVFSTSPPAALAAASIESLRIAQAEPERRRRVIALADRLRTLLGAAHWSVGASQSQIVPIVVGRPEGAVALSERLAGEGLFVPAIRPPTVPEGESMLRVSLSAAHTEGDLRRLVAALGTPPAPGQGAS